jgi:hypothetical protein
MGTNPNPGHDRESLHCAKARVAYFEALLDEHGTAYWNDATNWIALREHFEQSRTAAEKSLKRIETEIKRSEAP